MTFLSFLTFKYPKCGYNERLLLSLEKHLWNCFSLYLVTETLQFVHEIGSFPEVLFKKCVLRNFSKLIDKYKKQSSKYLPKKKKFLKFCKVHRKKSVLQSRFNKVQSWEPATLLKKSLAQALFCEICKLFKDNHFEEYLWISVSKVYLKRDFNISVFLKQLPKINLFGGAIINFKVEFTSPLNPV